MGARRSRGRNGSSSTSGTSSIALSPSTFGSSPAPRGCSSAASAAPPPIPTPPRHPTRCSARRLSASRRPSATDPLDWPRCLVSTKHPTPDISKAMARGISLRQFKPEDADAVYRWFNSPAATANLLEHRDDFSEEDARRWVERAIEQSGDETPED